MAFIYSDLMVPPLVAINARYYGRRMALYIAGVMWVSIVVTAVAMHGVFAVIGITPESGRAVDEITRFAIDYTFWLNLVMAVAATVMVVLHRAFSRDHADGMKMDMEGDGPVKRTAVFIMIAILAGGLISKISTLF